MKLFHFALSLFPTPSTAESALGQELELSALRKLGPLDQEVAIAKGLLKRAQERKIDTPKESAFYRLGPADRALLAAIERLHWKHPQLNELFNASEEDLAVRRWKLASGLTLTKTLSLPVIQAPTHPDLPVWHHARPWTCHYLDGQITGRQRHAIERVAGVDEATRQAIEQTRAVLITAQNEIPRYESIPGWMNALERLRQIEQSARVYSAPETLSTADLTKSILGRKELLFSMVLIAFALAWLLIKRLSAQ